MDQRSDDQPGESVSMRQAQTLYNLYGAVFGRIFGPKWEDLSEDSKRSWQDLTRRFVDGLS